MFVTNNFFIDQVYILYILLSYLVFKKITIYQPKSIDIVITILGTLGQ